MTFPYLIPAQLMAQATAVIQHGEVPSPCVKLVCAKGPHEMSQGSLLSQGNGGDSLCSGQFPTRSQDIAPREQRVSTHVVMALLFHLIILLKAIPFPKVSPGQQAASRQCMGSTHPKQTWGLCHQCVSCCHLSSGSSSLSWCQQQLSVLQVPLREMQSPVQMLHSVWVD